MHKVLIFLFIVFLFLISSIITADEVQARTMGWLEITIEEAVDVSSGSDISSNLLINVYRDSARTDHVAGGEYENVTKNSTVTLPLAAYDLTATKYVTLLYNDFYWAGDRNIDCNDTCAAHGKTSVEQFGTSIPLNVAREYDDANTNMSTDNLTRCTTYSNSTDLADYTGGLIASQTNGVCYYGVNTWDWRNLGTVENQTLQNLCKCGELLMFGDLTITITEKVN